MSSIADAPQSPSAGAAEVESSGLALVELLFSFGAFLAFYVWQMRELNRRAKARREGRDPDAPDRG